MTKATAARDEQNEDNEDGEKHLLWSSFYDVIFDNTKHTQLVLFTNGGIRTEQDGGNDEVNYQHETEKTTKGNAAVGKNMILIDNQFTYNVFYARHLLSNIRNINYSLNIHSNTGSTKTV